MLRIALYQENSGCGERLDWTRFGIQVTMLESLRQVLELDTATEVRVVVFELDAIDEATRDLICDRCHRHGIGTVAMVDPQHPHTGNFLTSDTDGLVSSRATPEDLACAAWNAHRQVIRRQKLSEELASVQLVNEQKRQIDRAVTIIAQQARIPEPDALRKLRREARNQRRTMHELASIINEGQDILVSALQETTEKKSSGNRRQLDGNDRQSVNARRDRNHRNGKGISKVLPQAS